MRVTGGCLCGAMRFELSTDRCSASPVTGARANTSLAAVFPKAALTITLGVPRTFWSLAESGTNTGRSFCEICGTPLFAENNRNSDFIAVKIGSLDDPSGFRVQMDIWRGTAQSWHKPHEGPLQFEKNPETLA